MSCLLHTKSTLHEFQRVGLQDSTGKPLIYGVLGPFSVELPVTRPFERWDGGTLNKIRGINITSWWTARRAFWDAKRLRKWAWARGPSGSDSISWPQQPISTQGQTVGKNCLMMVKIRVCVCIPHQLTWVCAQTLVEDDFPLERGLFALPC